jgi:uncharacterized membrane protein YccC
LREAGSEEIRATSRRLVWLAQAAQMIAEALAEKGGRTGAQHDGAALIAAAPIATPDESRFSSALHALDVECVQNVQTALEALSGVSSRAIAQQVGGAGLMHKAEQALRSQSPGTLELLRQNWTFASSALRHALRSAAVCVASVVLVRTLHVPYGEWMALTAVIVLQPYATHTWRKGAQRVGGTIAGGVLAAALAVFIHSPQTLILAMCITSFFTLAWYAVDYAWYCFFLTPTFVLLTLHGQHGWGVASIRAMDTVLGAGLALIAVKLLWTEPEHLRLGSILARSAQANQAYMVAMVRYWSTPQVEKADADRDFLAPARRQAGLANTESEEALERAMMENSQDSAVAARTEHAFSFVTYSRRLTQGITTVALLRAQPVDDWTRFVEDLSMRLDHIVKILQGDRLQALPTMASLPIGEEQGQSMRLRRQVEVLEKSALGFRAPSLP